ncbi:efflux transporter outer membrane subunit [Suttonella sp. R2A3]|uniref:efflux transporter outer membrane subunit n=1 Tax=Suttonella sp. R2A3 TaxID=2908648 RepID=UPI001F314272|nr:efflux transporter outer membrane subunit [Suttonella sp. R2A3]UJF23778.1 efflux transporter outer membrane subunit [Suttonella sp. R2A3]
MTPLFLHLPIKITVALLLAGCASLDMRSSQEDVASIAVPQDWLFAVAEQQATAEQQWWQAYESAALDQLIQRALAHNQDLRSAALNWQKAQLAVTQSTRSQEPQFNGSLGASANRNFDNRSNNQSFSSGLSASYQVDLWQKLSVSEDMAQWSAEASSEDLLAARLSVTADVVRAYINLAWIDEQLCFYERNLAYSRDSLERMRARYELGNVAHMEVTRSEQSLAQLAINKEGLEKARSEQLMQLSLLLGEAPQRLAVNPASLEDITLPSRYLPLPATLLRQRPDLRAAQYRLQQQLGEVVIAERAFYPEINLNGGLSAGGVNLGEILSNPIGNLGLNISLPFLNSRQLVLAKKQQELSYQQALTNFEKSLYSAMKDVNSALLNQQHYVSEEALLSEQLARAKRLTSQVRARYELGADSMQTLLDAEQSARDAELALLANRHNQLSTSVDLALALGGSTQIE